MKTFIKTAHGTAILGGCLLAAVTLINFSVSGFNSFPSVSVNISPRSQLAALEGAGSELVGWWKFDEGSGTVAGDSSGNGNTGTLTNGPTWATGQVGSNALQLDGSNDRVAFGSEFIGTGAKTFSAWIKLNSIREASIVENRKSIFETYLSGTSGLIRYSSDGNVTNAVSAIGSITTNTWYFVVATRDGSGVANIYINGALSGSPNQNSGTPVAGTYNMQIGNSTFGSRPVDGIIDDVRIYNRVLSAAEVADLYAQGGGTVSVPTAANGSCGATLNSCTAGTLQDTADSETQYLWSCAGANGGTTAACTLPKSTSGGTTTTVPPNTGITPTAGTITYYVSTSGDDTNPGTSGAPLRTIQKCADVARAGNTCLISPGTYLENVTTKSGGSASNPSACTLFSGTFPNYTMNPSCDAQRITFKSASGNVTLNSISVTHPFIAVDGLQFTGNTSRNGYIQLSSGADYCNITNNVVHDGPEAKYGIYFYTAANHCSFKGNQFNRIRFVFVHAQGRGHLFEGNVFELPPSSTSETDFLRPFGENIIFRQNVFKGNGTNSLGGHPDLIQVWGNDILQPSNNILFEQNWVQDVTTAVGQMGSRYVRDGRIAPIHDYVFRNNVFVNVTGNFSNNVPGVQMTNNTFYRAFNGLYQGGMGIGSTLARGDSSRALISGNAFVASGHQPDTTNIRGFYSMPSAALDNESIAILDPSHSISSDFTKKIHADLVNDLYTDPNGGVLPKARALASCSDFTLSASASLNTTYSAYKDSVCDYVLKAVAMDNLVKSTYYIDYNFAAGVAPTYAPKQSSRCAGNPTPYNFCEPHGINGGNPNFANEFDPDGPDNVPFTLDDGLKPLAGSPLCGKGQGGTDIGAYSCSANIVFAGSSIIATAANGSCSSSLNMCTSGTFSDQTDTSTNSLWQCLGSNGGTTASCTLPKSTQISTLTVTKSGTGSGTVSGGAISCGSVCTQAGIAADTQITLTAVAATGSVFTGWSGGGCSGTGTCTIPVSADTAVTATFSSQVQVDTSTLPCDVGPKIINAYTVLDGNFIRIVWPSNDYRQELHISRRIYSSDPGAWRNWTEIFAVTDAAQAKLAGEYRDAGVNSGIHYEYQISALAGGLTCGTSNYPYWSYEYINTGSMVPLVDQRGKLILLVENSLATPLASELTRLEDDLVGAGYKVYRHDVAASDVTSSNWKSSVASTKALIRADYTTDTASDWTIFIVGHVPIPYAGLSSPGGHTDNFGAHPADWYYADMTESGWTDTTANDTTAATPANWNIPGDGKFDQSYIPTAPELRIGRIDLRNMPAFGKSEVELMRQYLNRDHAWRHKQFTARDRGLVNINNNRGLIYKGRPFDSHNTYASFFGGAQNTDLGAWLTDAGSPATSYLFAASSGNGEYAKDFQIGTTADFAARALYVVFPSMYGSYYGDWDSAVHPDAVLQAPLAAQGYAVNNTYHQTVMNINSSAMGEPIGQELFVMGLDFYATRNVQYIERGWVYNGVTYMAAHRPNNYVSLLGDPTLRVRIVAPPTNVAINASGADNLITWTAAADANIQGYHVYRAPVNNRNGFTRLTNTPVTATSFRDTSAVSGAYRYMVRAIKLEQSTSRSYYNASQGIFASDTITTPPSDQTAPSLSSITASSITTTSATISWSTNELATTQVQYGLTTAYGSQTTLNATPKTTHTVSLTGLTPNTLYHYRVISTDAAGNTATSEDGRFSTLSLTPGTQTPVINTPPGNVEAQTVTPSVTPAVPVNPILPLTTPITTPASTLPGGFTRHLTVGSTGTDVKVLQQYLNANGYQIALTGAGSPGKETTYYGPATTRAIQKFQCAVLRICSGSPTTNGYGNFGPATRAALNARMRAGGSSSAGGSAITPSVNSLPLATATSSPSRSESGGWTRNLKVGMTGADVKALQQYLNAKGFQVSLTGAGSPGNETTYYGPATARAVTRFQEAYRAEILTPSNLTRGTGFFGPSTRAQVERLR